MLSVCCPNHFVAQDLKRTLLPPDVSKPDVVSLCLENGMIPDLPRCSRHEILPFSPDTLLCLQWTKKGYRAYSRLCLTVCKMTWVLGVMVVDHSSVPPGSSFALPVRRDCQLVRACCRGEMNVR